MKLVSTRLLRYVLVIACGMAGILLFLLASASSNSTLFERHYPWLLGVNALLTLLILLLVIVLIRRLWRRYRAGVFGSHLTLRLALSFALMGMIPGATIYLVSVQFLSKSIESWFNVRVDAALESGLNLGRNALDALLAELNEKARSAANILAEQPEATQAIMLSRLRSQLGIEEMVLLNSSGRVIGSAGSRLATLLSDLPNTALMRQVRLSHTYAAVEEDTTSAAGMRLRVIIAVTPARSFSIASEPRYLQVLQNVSPVLASNAEAVQTVYRDYQELSLSRNGLRNIYTVTLTLTLLLAMLAAVAAAFLLASWLAEPLLQLAQGTKAVAEGDFSPMPERASKDELSLLTRSFNVMTRQLHEARATVEHNSVALENANTFLESILASLSAGVLVFDHEFRLAIANQSAERIFSLAEQSVSPHLGSTLEHVATEMAAPLLREFSQHIRHAFSEQSAVSADTQHWQTQIEFQRELQPHATEEQDHAPFVLLARGTRLPVKQRSGYVVVFDDISNVISAQRSAAWGEVARRLAHEIKNPLTPIQLSAERLQVKLAPRLAAADQALLERAIGTIINQVTAMKRMVDAFRDYARMPAPELHPLNLNDLIRDVLQLYGDSNESGASEGIDIALAPDLPLMLGDTTQLRQLIHNLLQNAQDAQHTQHPLNETSRRGIRLRTESVVSNDTTWVRLRVEDHGSGFPNSILNRAFEPYITTKPKGTGLGLAIVKKIVDEHQGRIDLQNRLDDQQVIVGARVSVLFMAVPTT